MIKNIIQFIVALALTIYAAKCYAKGLKQGDVVPWMIVGLYCLMFASIIVFI